jgi:hypothetical protein
MCARKELYARLVERLERRRTKKVISHRCVKSGEKQKINHQLLKTGYTYGGSHAYRRKYKNQFIFIFCLLDHVISRLRFGCCFEEELRKE